MSADIHRVGEYGWGEHERDVSEPWETRGARTGRMSSTTPSMKEVLKGAGMNMYTLGQKRMPFFVVIGDLREIVKPDGTVLCVVFDNIAEVLLAELNKLLLAKEV